MRDTTFNLPRTFRLHFNRINMQRGKDEVWTIHLSNECIPAREVVVHVPLITKFRKDGPQPRAYLYGKGRITHDGDGVYRILP